MQLDFVAGAAGMAVFFCLSGFLIVTFLHRGMAVGEFLMKRLARIVLMAWVAMIAPCPLPGRRHGTNHSHCMRLTGLRIVNDEMISIVTWHRVDEILAGGTLTLLYAHGRQYWLRHYPLWLGTGETFEE